MYSESVHRASCTGVCTVSVALYRFVCTVYVPRASGADVYSRFVPELYVYVCTVFSS